MKNRIDKTIKTLTTKGVEFASGLTDKEVLDIEVTFNFKFPPDLKEFLQKGLPVSERFVNWRLGLKSKKEFNKIQNRLNWPWEGMLFDIKHNTFWLKNWGIKPKNHDESFKIARQNYETYPKLIPIYSHRYIPESPNESGNPIFSVYQMDIIYFGTNLENYLIHEFKIKPFKNSDRHSYKRIDFWSSIVEGNL